MSYDGNFVVPENDTHMAIDPKIVKKIDRILELMEIIVPDYSLTNPADPTKCYVCSLEHCKCGEPRIKGDV